MAPLPVNSTPVFFVDYNVMGESHTAQFRGALGVTASQLATVATTFFQQIDSILYNDWAVVGTRFRQAGSTISLPSVPLGTITPAGGTAVENQSPKFLSWVGRGVTSGRRVRVYVYGANFTVPDDYRFQDGEIAIFDDARGVLNAASDAEILATIANDTPLWNEYTNVGYNSYWEREARG